MESSRLLRLETLEDRNLDFVTAAKWFLEKEGPVILSVGEHEEERTNAPKDDTLPQP